MKKIRLMLALVLLILMLLESTAYATQNYRVYLPIINSTETCDSFTSTKLECLKK